jgi:RNA polymerase sigma-70 factor (ECF subfamily)
MSGSVPELAFGVLPAQTGEFVDGYIRIPEAGEWAGDAPQPSLLGRIRQKLRSDEELALQLQKGNSDALTEIFGRHSSLVFRIARRVLRNDAEAEDAVQQTFIDIYRSIQQYDKDRGSFKSWLLIFAYHRTFNRRRALVASRFFETDPLENFLPEILGGPSCQPRLSTGEMAILVEQVLAGLEPRQRRTIELVYFEGLTADEITVRTGETVRVVRHNLYRGLEKLRKRLCSREDAELQNRRPDGGMR